MPTVSVVIPVYNVEKFVEACIRSVLDQSFTDFEILIVNDLSPDRSLEICQGFDDSRIRIINHKENRGLAGARNTGIRNAAGKYVAFLDSDDLWDSEKLQEHVRHLEGSPTVGVSFSRSAFINEAGVNLNMYQMPKLSGITPSHLMCRNPIGNGSAPVIRREVLDEIATVANFHGQEECHYFDHTFRQSEDIECWIRIAATTSWTIEGISSPLTLYRLNSASLSSDIPKQLDSWERVMDKVKLYAPELWSQSYTLARAFQLRYLARQAIRQKRGSMALALTAKAIASNPAILLKEPSRTTVTLIAALTLIVMPAKVYQWLEPFGLYAVGHTQKLRMAIR